MGKIGCCKLCFEKAEEANPGDGMLWIVLCAHSIPDGTLSFEDDFKELCDLERAGFLVTHETESELLVKMHGMYMDEEDTPYFCTEKTWHKTMQ